MPLYINGYSTCLPEEFSIEKVSAIKDTSYSYGKLSMKQDSEFFPSRSDSKIMRSDVKMAIVTMREMLAQLKFAKPEIEKASLFVANGVFLEEINKNLDRTLAVYQSFPKGSSLEVKLKDLYRASPPLLALETLTNSAMSFIAQYAGIKGNNATYGNTSLSAIHCLQSAEIDLNLKDVKNAFVCGANCAGNYSFLMNNGIVSNGNEWRESAGVGCLSLVKEKSDENRLLCEITDIVQGTSVPSLRKVNKEKNWQLLMPEEPSDLLIFSGAFNKEENEKDLDYCKSFHHNVMTLFDKYGNMGAANLPIGIIQGIESFSDEIKCVDVVDRDVYGRESLIRITKC